MLRRIGFASLFYLCSSPAPAHDAFILDARRATSGPRLELIELPAAELTEGKRYRLHVEPGLPRGVIFGVFTKPFDHGFHEAEPGFQLDESGDLVSGDARSRRRLDNMTFGPGP